MKVDVLAARHLRKCGAWYFLPRLDQREKNIEIYQAKSYKAIRIPAKKLLRELIAVGVKP